ncbi:hypothetical protein CBR_g21966 [Chara braunii]|uniref:Uncharacterized protein n=1 Tax=Chara braunii TaxID=69332 RepID=A0A388L1T4_CHABU|nr:hypothetical protein CBR_g21966 [Chara braunii]|eukprot:GBG76218.1 hypothetical protein CBR_g21966 [Chara braunii]
MHWRPLVLSTLSPDHSAMAGAGMGLNLSVEILPPAGLLNCRQPPKRCRKLSRLVGIVDCRDAASAVWRWNSDSFGYPSFRPLLPLNLSVDWECCLIGLVLSSLVDSLVYELLVDRCGLLACWLAS